MPNTPVDLAVGWIISSDFEMMLKEHNLTINDVYPLLHLCAEFGICAQTHRDVTIAREIYNSIKHHIEQKPVNMQSAYNTIAYRAFNIAKRYAMLNNRTI